MANFSIAAIMNNSGGTHHRGGVGDSGDLSSLASQITDHGMALTNRIHQQQLTSLREHAFLQLGRRGFEDSALSPLSRFIYFYFKPLNFASLHPHSVSHSR